MLRCDSVFVTSMNLEKKNVTWNAGHTHPLPKWMLFLEGNITCFTKHFHLSHRDKGQAVDVQETKKNQPPPQSEQNLIRCLKDTYEQDEEIQVVKNSQWSAGRKRCERADAGTWTKVTHRRDRVLGCFGILINELGEDKKKINK